MTQKYVDWVFCYLDRSYLLPKQNSLHDMAVQLFRSIVFEHPKLNKHIIDGACDLIAVDREGKDLDRQTFEKTIKMFHEMLVYTKHFEPRMLEMSQKYIADWADREAAEKSLADYVKTARELMKREITRVEMFGLVGSTKRDLLTLLEDHLISRKEARLSESPQIVVILGTLLTFSQLIRTISPTSSRTTQSKISSFSILSSNVASSARSSSLPL